MQLRDGRLTCSPSDLSAFLACAHLTTLQLEVARGELDKPYRVSPHADLIRRKGEEHEEAYLEALRVAGRDVVEIGLDGGWDDAVRATEEALCDGRDVVYQATFEHDGWRGRADFVERQADGSYEVVDTKLARHAKPEHVLQLCFYTEQVGRITGRAPAAMHVYAGLGEREEFSPGDYAAYYRRVKRRFAAATSHGNDTYPYPVDRCGICDFLELCKQRWREDDHLKLVAGIRRSDVERLTEIGITTLAELGQADPGTAVEKMRAPIFDRLRHQAELQLRHRMTGEHCWDLLEPEDDRGFALLPESSPGDVWLDLEGHPWFETSRGLEYLFGWVYLDEQGEPRYDCAWAFDREGEKAAFERFVDWVVERRLRYPSLHVYHYANYERTALTRLMGQYATREQEIDDLLRREVLVDLFRVVKQGLRASVESYSIKDVEKLYAFEREAEVGSGSASVVAFEDWLDTGVQSLLDGIRDYNRDDCISTYELHRWLLNQRPRDMPWRASPGEQELNEEKVERIEAREQVYRRLLEGDEYAQLLAHLLEYHRREEKPQWWEYFDRLKKDSDDLFNDSGAISELELVGEPELDGQSYVYTLSFPAQEHKIGGKGVDPATEKTYTVTVSDELGLVRLWRGVKRADESLPNALIPISPIIATEQKAAILRFAVEYLDGGGRRALIDVLDRRPPRARLDLPPVEAAASLDNSYLFVQGPPGSGKTYTGARMAVELMRRGQRIGVTALSHKAINNFLEHVHDAAVEGGFEFRGGRKADGDNRYEDEFVECTNDNDAMTDPDLQLVGGTSWLFSREEMEVDTLFIDEAGQFALADAIAVGTSARNLVLLGDPNQLPQVSQGVHPEGASASVLEHLLGEETTVRPDMGLFLAETWRLRPEVCTFISETFYNGRLEPAVAARARILDAGSGVRYSPVAHAGHRSRSPEEAKEIAEVVARLVGTEFTEGDAVRPLEYDDIVVVAPYNAHVRCLHEALPEGVRIGTVDKFQGQQAAVVFYSMASSSGEDVPRGLGFLLSRNRLNVAISRAQCLAHLVASPRLLDADCRTIDQIRLANALSQFVEAASAAKAEGSSSSLPRSA